MRSIQLVAPRTLEERDIPQAPDPGPGEVTVRLRAVGICGSDMHWYLEGGIGANRATYPLILGHEPAGEIVALGKGVDHLRIGQKIALEPAIHCGHCEHCMSGRHNNCLFSTFMGSSGVPGLFREYATVPAANCDAVPDSFTFSQITMLEPLAVMVHVLELVDIRVGDTVAVLGAGPVGMLAATIAKIAGASRVFIGDKVPHRLELAFKMGVDSAYDIKRMREAVMDETRGRGVDVVIDAAAAIETINLGIQLARVAGKYTLIGIPSEPELNIDLNTAMNKELSFQMIKRSNHNGQAAIELMRAGRVPDAMITHHLPLEKTAQGFETLANYADGVGKVVIEI
jgi:L-iditol 2-dehydrogenase